MVRKGERTGFGVALEAEHNLRGAIPARGYVFSHEASVFVWIYREAAGETKVTDFELTVCVHEKIAGLEISMQDVGRVDIFQTAEDLIDERLEVRVGQGLA